jgi:hypothetical protein
MASYALRREILMPDEASTAATPAALAGRVRSAQVIAWWASARAAGARAVVTEMTTGPGTLLVGLDVFGTQAADEAGGTARRWQVLTVKGDRITDIRGFDDRTEAAARAGLARP